VAARQWTVGATFYAALHGVERGLAGRRQASADHRDRAGRIQKTWPAAVQAGRAYDHLRDVADRVRDQCWIPSDAWLAEAQRDLRAVRDGLAPDRPTADPGA